MSEKKTNEYFRGKKNQDVSGDGNLFWKKVGQAKRWKMENCSRVYKRRK